MTTYDPHNSRDMRDSIHITRDESDAGIIGFAISLGTEGVDVFMPFSSIEPNMPDEDRKLLNQNASSFLRKYGQVMISEARNRLSKGELGSPEDLERFEATERMRRDEELLSPQEAEILANLRTNKGGAVA